ncbi:M28 family peptidase [bacterium]|nr:M28 family peptidase [bacterium]
MSAVVVFMLWTVAPRFSVAGGVENDSTKKLNQKIYFTPADDHFISSEINKKIDKVDGMKILEFVKTLTADSFEGRASGTIGYNKAGQWLAGQFKRVGIKPFLKHSYFQPFKIAHQYIRQRIYADVKGDSAETFNVIGWIEGQELKNEFVVMTAHLDHLGMKLSMTGDKDTIFYGANDNASGVSVMLSVGETLVEMKPKRSILFVAFSGEEVGLLGSKYFVEHSPVPLEQIRFLLNLDLVGSGHDGIMVQGVNDFPQEFSTVSGINRSYFGFELSTRPNSPNSDQYYFNALGVPAFFMYAYKGTNPYHLPGDVWQGLDMMVLENVAKFSAMVVWKFAQF